MESPIFREIGKEVGISGLDVYRTGWEIRRLMKFSEAKSLFTWVVLDQVLPGKKRLDCQ